MIISLINQKGGVGKTTLSVNIAHQLSMQYKVLLVDADPQQSALNWSEVRTKKLPFNVIGLAKKSLHRDLPAIACDYQDIIIDGPPRVTDLSRSCIMASDMVIIPCTPSPYDLWASIETVELIKDAYAYKEKLKSLFVVNRKIINTVLGRDFEENLKTLNMPIFKTTICQRVIFAESATAGLTVFDMEADNKAAFEITQLVNEILS